MSGNGKALTLDEIFKADDFAIEKVDCPEWGGCVYVRSIGADERDEFDAAFAKGGSLVGMRRTFVGKCLCDENGKPLNPSPAQVQLLGRRASGVMDRVFTAAIKLNKMRPDDVEAIEKNLETANDSGSS